MRNAVLLWLSSWVPLKIPACNGEVRTGERFFSFDRISARLYRLYGKYARQDERRQRVRTAGGSGRSPIVLRTGELALFGFFPAGAAEAQDPTTPLLGTGEVPFHRRLELAEFFMVRVAGLKQQCEAESRTVAGRPDSLEHIRTVRRAAQELMNDTRTCLRKLLGPLKAAGIRIIDFGELEENERAAAAKYFDEVVFPVLTPHRCGPGQAFPLHPNMSLNLAVVIARAEPGAFCPGELPATLPRLLRVDADRDAEGKSPCGAPAALSGSIRSSPRTCSRFSRDADPASPIIPRDRDAEVQIQELEAEDLLETIEPVCASGGRPRGPRHRGQGRCPRTSAPSWSKTSEIMRTTCPPSDRPRHERPDAAATAWTGAT